MSQFSPPKFKPPKDPVYATYIENRRPKFKGHANRGQALNAINYAFGSNKVRGGIIYKREGDEWVEVMTVPVDFPRKVRAEDIA